MCCAFGNPKENKINQTKSAVSGLPLLRGLDHHPLTSQKVNAQHG